MCGIAGVISTNGSPVDPAVIKRMCDVQAHRGPDDAGYALFRPFGKHSTEGGYWCEFAEPEFRHLNENLPPFGGQFFEDEVSRSDFTVLLGHRRLSIIELTHYGHQPMGSSDRRLWVTYNGEIYNYRELKEELRAQGHIFRTRSDTEVILHLWEQYGVESLEKLDGMFALALYDLEANILTLARDRFGVKPVYYALTERAFLFASEIKGILASGLVSPEIDPKGVVEYFTFQNIFGSGTLFRSVELLPQGHYVKVEPVSGPRPEPRSYHRGFPIVDPGLAGQEDLTETISHRFADAVRRQLVSDVEVGSFLSGGMDSGSIVAVARSLIPRMVTFTGGFDLTHVNGIEQGFDERELAERLSYLLQTEHYAVVLHAGDMPAAMERLTWHMDDPRVGMCHQNWYVAKLASKFVKVCLAGSGGDELFGGYPWRYRHVLDARDFEECDRACFRYWHRLLSPGELRHLFSPDLRRYLGSSWVSFQCVLAGAPPYQHDLGRIENLLQRVFYFEFKTFMQGVLITEDRVSMAHGLETRVPFLDNELADLAWKIPSHLKVNADVLLKNSTENHIETAEGKLVLRSAMEAFLPSEYTTRKKQGFSPPDENWYRGPSMDYIKAVLLDRQTLQRPWFNENFVLCKLNEHFNGTRNHRLLIWSLLSFEWLQRHFIDQEAPPC